MGGGCFASAHAFFIELLIQIRRLAAASFKMLMRFRPSYRKAAKRPKVACWTSEVLSSLDLGGLFYEDLFCEILQISDHQMLAE
jgi:hypothetical protein